MAIQLGAKDPKREITLGRFGSIIFIVCFLAIMIPIAYYLAMTFIVGEDYGQTYLNCKDGSIEEIEEGKFTYCGEYVGADTVEGIKRYKENLNQFSDTVEIDFNKEFVVLEE